MKLPTAALLASMAAFPALARQEPTPPPSGIVIHLFGPDSVTSHILPTSPSSQQGGKATPQDGGPQGENAPAQTSSEPTAGDILHQMFVTGDPEQDSKPHPAPGRNGAF